jgi:hypothetical protein
MFAIDAVPATAAGLLQLQFGCRVHRHELRGRGRSYVSGRQTTTVGAPSGAKLGMLPIDATPAIAANLQQLLFD